VSGLAASAPQASESVSPEPAEAGGAFRIQAVDRAVLLLKSVAASATPPTVLELARACGINLSTAWRLLRTLEHHGLIDRDPVTQRYTVGYGAITIAAAVTDDTLVRRVRPLLKDLSARTEESVTLAVAKRFNLVYVDQVDPPNMMSPNWLDRLPATGASRRRPTTPKKTMTAWPAASVTCWANRLRQS
jgi:predicted transcriptional regulator